ncbi:PAS domain S-box-containing protein/diguanylate cyclase (GGDEF) domain-containing protein [Sphingomonas laterariae]|uniref:PAS domain S-box-containing protein/diguanylate cyclase (GGDEF) domain-containing protein n=1 Tax=Edaphosphingomonas laterariae TaxID=861865 RepID=A0A239JWE3_9SPHN|nr:diguanylate cyclase [Sphingomonas laterariae]SNT09733.1 PAS domain S-box-containing protein/diguanylate cyclase (GGDEF) domain-containing protein [Sphingomonas laterariae]
MFNGAFHSAVIGMALVGLDGGLKRVNPSFAQMLGYEVAELEQLGFQAVTHADDLDSDLELFEAVLRGEIDHYRLEKRYLRRDGGTMHGMLSVSVVRDGDGAAELFVSQIEDVTQQKAAERSAREDAERLELALEVLDGGPWQYDIASKRFTMSPYLTRFVCGEGGEPIGNEEFLARIHPDDRALDFDAVGMGVQDRSVGYFRIRIHTGEYRWVRSTCKLLRDAAGRPETIVGVSVDITDERHRQARLQAEAESDALTGLLNRRGFERRTAGDPARWHGVVVIDLDRFKQVNDDYGHAAGDKVLREAGKRIAANVRKGDAVARLGGDEFAVLLTADGPCDCHALADRMLQALHRPYMLDGTPYDFSASIGIASRNHEDEGVDALLVRADAALYEAKRAGRAAWRMAA